MAHLYSVWRVAGGGICLVFFHFPRRQLWAETGSQSRLSSGQNWQTGDPQLPPQNPSILLEILYFLPNFFPSAPFLPAPCPRTEPPPLPIFILISNEKHLMGFRKPPVAPWRQVQGSFWSPGSHPSIHPCWPCPFVWAGIVMQVWGTSYSLEDSWLKPKSCIYSKPGRCR